MSAIGGSEYESQRLRHLFTSAAPMAEINAELLKSYRVTGLCQKGAGQPVTEKRPDHREELV